MEVTKPVLGSLIIDWCACSLEMVKSCRRREKTTCYGIRNHKIAKNDESDKRGPGEEDLSIPKGQALEQIPRFLKGDNQEED